MPDDPYFEVGYHVDRYYELEEDFLKALKIMPLEIYNTPELREKAISIYFAELLLRIGSNIDIILKKMIISKYKTIYDDKLNKINEKRKMGKKDPVTKTELKFEDYMELNEKCIIGFGRKLSDLDVTIIQTNESIRPFKGWDKKEISVWWSSYNHIKHQADFDKANLQNVLEALAALFVLICINKNTSKLLIYGYLQIPPGFKGQILRRQLKEFKNEILTKVFISPISS